MRLVRLEECRSGQRVAQDVLDGRGNLLYKAGALLTAEVVERLRKWKVTHLFIDDDGTTTRRVEVDRQRREVTVDKELDHVFAGTTDHPVMAKLREAAARYLKGKPE